MAKRYRGRGADGSHVATAQDHHDAERDHHNRPHGVIRGHRNLFEVPVERVHETSLEQTWFTGRLVHDSHGRGPGTDA